MISDLHFSWLEGAILCPLVGAAVVAGMRDSHLARKWCVFFSGLTLSCAVGAWLDFQISEATQADDRWHLLSQIFGQELLVIDKVSAPLLALVALLYFLTQVATVRTKIERFPFAASLLSESILLAMYSCEIPWGIVVLLALGTVLPGLELRSRRRASQVYWTYMLLFVGLMCTGQYYLSGAEPDSNELYWGTGLLGAAMLVRSGITPFHSWVPDLFERATFGTALLYVTPMAGAYGIVRLVVPQAPHELLNGMALFAIGSALYTSAIALIQREGRRFYSYLFLSAGALVVAGLSNMSHHGLTGGLCVWLSFAISLGGLGLTLRAMEARRGRLSMETFQGLYDHTPNLAMCFGLTALASVGFPGTFGFVGTELLIDATVESHPYVGIIVVVATGINGIAVVQTFFRLFGGAPYLTSVSFQIRTRERYAVLVLAAVVFTGGLFPQPIVASRSRAAEEILQERLPHRHHEDEPAIAVQPAQPPATL